ncbi:hypothetical protein M1N86_01710 [Dehalococcoidia bacterium]|nr:hypothetical protein [Dehalococcoidia bacterium]
MGRVSQDGTEARPRFTVPNNLPGDEQMVGNILEVMERYHVDRLVVGLPVCHRQGSYQSLLVASGLLA